MSGFIFYMLAFIAIMTPAVFFFLFEYNWRVKRVNKHFYKLQYTRFVWVYALLLILFLLIGTLLLVFN